MTVRILQGDALQVLRGLPNDHFHSVWTSPPYYGLRAYLPDGDPQKHLEVGQEESPAAYVAAMVGVMEEVRRVLRPDGVCWLNLGDSYASGGRTWRAPNANGMRSGASSERMDWRPRDPDGVKPKDLLLIPARLSIALQEAGWWIRRDVIWHKLNPMPESVEDRPITAHEYLFMLTKSERYFFDWWRVREDRTSDEDSAVFRGGCYVGGGTDNDMLGTRVVRGNRRVGRPTGADAPAGDGKRLCRSVWPGPSEPTPYKHFATAPSWLVRRSLEASTCEAGCCGECGAPMRRVLERRRFRDGLPLEGAWAKPEDARRLGPTGVGHWRDSTVLAFKGWEPGCGCQGAAVGRCRVLDPFLGAGTTAWVGDGMQLDCVGIELNPKYVALAQERIGGLLVEVG